MRTARLSGLFVVALILSSTLPLLAATSGAPAAPSSSSTIAERVTLEDLFGVQTSADEPFLAASWSCPTYTQICTTNSQCDAYCGGAGWGACISFGGARRCCACNT